MSPASNGCGKFNIPDGQREINELHVPTGRPVKLTLASEDVIHSFYIPAFRLKHDVVPGSYQTYWFEPTKPGRYHIFCAEYCGTNHSRMIGWVTVMESGRCMQAWLAERRNRTTSMADHGRKAVRAVWLRDLSRDRISKGALRRSTMCSDIPCSWKTDGP